MDRKHDNLVDALCEWANESPRRIPPTVVWDHPTIDSLAEHLGE